MSSACIVSQLSSGQGRGWLGSMLLACCLAAIIPWQLAAKDLPVELDTRLEACDTLDLAAEPLADAQACLEGLRWEPKTFPIRFEAADLRCGDLVVRFPSPFDTGHAVNDQVAMEWYVARDAERKPRAVPAVVVVHESGSGMTVGRLIAKGIAVQGLHAFLVQLPGYGRRKGDPPRDDVERFRLLHQAIADVRRARDAVAVLPMVETETIGLQGTSLGGFVCATVAGLDRGFDRTFILLAGGNLHEVIEQGTKDAARLRERLARAGLEGESLRKVTARVEPLRLAHRIDPENTWLFTGRHDDVVPPASSQAFAQAARLAEDHHVVLNADHYSGIILLPKVLADIHRHMTGREPGDQP